MVLHHKEKWHDLNHPQPLTLECHCDQRLHYPAVCWTFCRALSWLYNLYNDGSLHCIWPQSLSRWVMQPYYLSDLTWHLLPDCPISRMDELLCHLPKQCCVHLSTWDWYCLKFSGWYQCSQAMNLIWTSQWHLQNSAWQLHDSLIFVEELSGPQLHSTLPQACWSTVSAKKFFVCRPEVTVVGQTSNYEGCTPDDSKVSKVCSWPACLLKMEVCSFLGLAGTIHTWVKDFTSITQPLVQLTKPNIFFIWIAKHQQAMDHLKEAVASSSVVCPFNYTSTNEVILLVNSSHITIRYILSQVVLWVPHFQPLFMTTDTPYNMLCLTSVSLHLNSICPLNPGHWLGHLYYGS